MCGTILWVSKQNDSTTPQSIYSMHWWPSFLRGRIEIFRRMVKKYVLKLFWNAYTWHELDDQIFYGQWTNLHDQSQNGPRSVTNDWIVWYFTSITHVNIYSIVMWCNTAEQCRLGLSDFAGDLEDSKSTSGGTLCVFGSHTFVPISWMCKKQTSVSSSWTESEIISLDAGLRLDTLTALDLWDLIVTVLGNTNQSHDRIESPVCELKWNLFSTSHDSQT